jgi:hypothetical protein
VLMDAGEVEGWRGGGGGVPSGRRLIQGRRVVECVQDGDLP